ncbi:MAG: hypothetical protein ACR2PA_26915 [Hyphomicrobiaceae bacterium]
MADRQLYEFTTDGFLFGRHWKAGETELFYPKQVEGQGHRMKPSRPSRRRRCLRNLPLG